MSPPQELLWKLTSSLSLREEKRSAELLPPLGERPKKSGRQVSQWAVSWETSTNLVMFQFNGKGSKTSVHWCRAMPSNAMIPGTTYAFRPLAFLLPVTFRHPCFLCRTIHARTSMAHYPRMHSRLMPGLWTYHTGTVRLLWYLFHWLNICISTHMSERSQA